MEENKEMQMVNERKAGRKNNGNFIKMGSVAVVSLLLLIPLVIVRGIISEREQTKEAVEREIAETYADEQSVGGAMLYSIIEKKATDSCDAQTERAMTRPTVLDYRATVDTDMLHRSIYDVIVYNAKIEITGNIRINSKMLGAKENILKLDVKDFKGLYSLPSVAWGGKRFAFERLDGELITWVEIPNGAKEGDKMDFSISLRLKGSKSLMFYPYAEQTTASIISSYPHPSFQGDFLPESREVGEDGFKAKWNVLRMNTDSDNDKMGVKFVDPANPYQQATRSAKYGLLIIFLTFVASMLVEYLTRREINIIQYGVIGLSLVLFYVLMLSFSEFIVFGAAYAVAALMTVSALTCYYRAILKNKCAYLLTGFVTIVYVINYILLQMETYALLASSLVIFVMLTVVMYITAEMKMDK